MADVGSMRARYRRILRFALRYMVQTWWYELILPRIGLRAISDRGRAVRLQTIAQRFHDLAVSLGGLMIKVGQFLSARLDVLPPEITKELAGLQDEVPPVGFPAIRALAETELGMPLERAFAFVEETPVAAASLGQAHRARLLPAEAADTGFADVVVKVQRPGIEKVVDVDLAALRRVAKWLNRVRVVAAHVDAPALVEEFALVCADEIDYLHEAGNAHRFAEDFAGDPGVGVPAVAWERTSLRVLTLEDVTAIKVNDLDALRAAGIEPSEVASTFAAVMFQQLFVNGMFHADPHPGNLFVTPIAEPGDGPRWRLTFVDFGMMGELSDSIRDDLRSLLIAVAARDGKKMIDSIRDVGLLLPSADTAELERAMTELFARFGGMGLAELQEVDPREFREFAREFGDVMRSLPFQLPESLLLLFRTVGLISGLCSALDPRFNMWDAVEPFAAKVLRDEGGNTVQALAREAVATAETLARLPRRFDDLVSRLESGQLAVDTPRLDQRMRRLERTGRRIVSAVLFAGLFVGGIVLRSTEAVLGGVVIAVSVIPLVHALFAGRFSGR